ncbi:MAG: cyclic nucleotide-binding domain-containing protein [Kiloniellales bacterium]|nr:cyclic nucleotide-binding domain-containing protein [Kiloniellales bacterium]
MGTRTLEPYLAEHPLFRDLNSDYVALLSECAFNVRFAEGERIFRHGEPADRFFLIRHGIVSLEIWSPTQGPLTIQTLGPGEVLGWSWLFPPYKWHFDARATEPTRAVALDGKCLRGKCDQDPKLGYEMMKRFSALIHARMQAARLQIMDIYGPTSA